MCVGETGMGKTTLIESLFNMKLEFRPCNNELKTVELLSRTYGKCVIIAAFIILFIILLHPFTLFFFYILLPLSSFYLSIYNVICIQMLWKVEFD